jgi:hypothetical protein
MKKLSKRILALSVAALIAAMGVSGAFAADLKGDVNGDGKVTSADALMVLQHTIGMEVKDMNLTAADLNADGTINSADALKILQICVGIVDPEPVKTPLDYSKAELVTYYNTALEKAYLSEKVTIAKKTNVKVTIDELSAKSLLSLGNSLIEKYAVPTSDTKTFNSGVAADKTTAKSFLVPYDLEADGAKEVKVSKTENGYRVVITLVDEKVDHKTAPKYNTEASLPLVIDEKMINGYGATIKSSSLDYTGTVITADIDSNGNITALNHTMPLKLSGSGKYGVFSVTGSGHGEYTLDATFTY